MRIGTSLAILATLTCALSVTAQVEEPKPVQRRLGAVATAHLDTQWRWTIKNTIEEYILNTMKDNFRHFEQYPEYVFSFEGAFRYMLAKEYYPEEYARLKKYVAEGRWRVAGSWVDAVDVNTPSFESLVRHTLYGNGFYKEEFGKQSYDIFLPDCFGFGYALPSIAHHCGLKSFSTQKLTWGCSVPVPFSIGKWRGVDGSSILAGLNPGDYTTAFSGDLSRDTVWGPVIDSLGAASGCYAAYVYHGTGDVGGAPDSLSVDWLTKSMKSDGPIQVSAIGSDELVSLVANYPDANLLQYDGELVMTRHGVGCYTSQSAMKRWNRQNELLAAAAERAAVTASLLGGYTYPGNMLKQAWVRFLWHQFHDDLTGTSIPEAYEFSWSDELLSLNQFSSVLTSAVGAVTSALDTRGEGVSVVVYNPLSFARTDVAELTLPNEKSNAGAIQVFGPDGKEVPSQATPSGTSSIAVKFLATVPSVSFAVYDVRPGKKANDKAAIVTATATGLESERYRVSIDQLGDVISIFDKRASRELLAGPIHWELITDKPQRWPAWEIQYEDLQAGPYNVLWGAPVVEVLESGPVCGAIRVSRTFDKSSCRTTIRLAQGAAGDRIDFVNDVDWAERASLLKVAFKPTFTNDSVTYDLGLGTIKRGTSTEKKYEVPGQQWADLTSIDSSYGLAVLNDCKYGWDHPDPSTLRLTLIHTPAVDEAWNWVGDQRTQDLGHHQFTYSVAGHQGSWQDNGIPQQAARLNQPLRAFFVPAHEGALGKKYSLLKLEGDGQVMIEAIKKAEGSNEIIVRVKEVAGRPAAKMALVFNRPLAAATEVNGQEESVARAIFAKEKVSFALTPYQPKAFAVRFAASEKPQVAALSSQPITLTHDLDGISGDAERTDGNLDGLGNTLVAELLPAELNYTGVRFTFGPTTTGARNVVSCSGQTLTLPAPPAKSAWSDAYLLMLATGGPQEGVIKVEGGDSDFEKPVSLYEYTQPVGQWNNRIVNGEVVTDENAILPAYINQAPVAWAGTHRHSAKGTNDTYLFTYLYAQRVELPEGSRTIRLPDNPKIKLLAATVAGTQHDRVVFTTPVYDTASARFTRAMASEPVFIDSTVVQLSSPMPGTVVRYTVDGTEPDLHAAVYTEPLRLASTTTVKSKAYSRADEGGVTNSFNVHKLIPRAPVEVKNPASGLQASYYEGEWEKLPNFDSLPIVMSYVAPQVNIPDTARPEDYGLVFKGFVRVPAAGMYEFGISSDDGSALWVADTLVADNDGLHGDGEVAGKVALEPGLHAIEARMFQCKGGQALKMFVTGPGVERQEVGAAMLFHKPASRSAKK